MRTPKSRMLSVEDIGLEEIVYLLVGVLSPVLLKEA